VPSYLAVVATCTRSRATTSWSFPNFCWVLFFFLIFSPPDHFPRNVDVTQMPRDSQAVRQWSSFRVPSAPCPCETSSISQVRPPFSLFFSYFSLLQAFKHRLNAKRCATTGLHAMTSPCEKPARAPPFHKCVLFFSLFFSYAVRSPRHSNAVRMQDNGFLCDNDHDAYAT